MRKVPKCEGEEPPNSKIRVVATVDDKLVSAMELIHKGEVDAAVDADRVPPDWSNTVEMLLRKGVRTYKSASQTQK